jgi:hypothetical protein
MKIAGRRHLRDIDCYRDQLPVGREVVRTSKVPSGNEHWWIRVVGDATEDELRRSGTTRPKRDCGERARAPVRRSPTGCRCCAGQLHRSRAAPSNIRGALRGSGEIGRPSVEAIVFEPVAPAGAGRRHRSREIRLYQRRSRGWHRSSRPRDYGWGDRVGRWCRDPRRNRDRGRESRFHEGPVVCRNSVSA